MSLSATAVFAVAPQEVEMLQNNSSKTYLLDNLPKDLYEELHFDLKPPNEQEVVEEAMRCLLDRRNHRLPLSCIRTKDSGLASELQKLDSDNDGYLSYDELLKGVEALLRHKMRARQLAWLFVILFVFSLTMLGGIYGLVFAVVDMSKDTQAVNAVLMSRSNGAPVQVASTDYFIQDGTLTVRKLGNPTTAASIKTGTLSPPPNVGSTAMQSVSGDEVDNTVKTSQALFTYDRISSALPNDAISKISQLTITAGPDPTSPFIRINIDSIMRIPNLAGYGDGSILLIFSSAGRFVVNGTEVIPANGDLATKNITELHSMAIIKPIDIVNHARRQDLHLSFNTNCNARNACRPRGNRRDETDCCYGQIFQCTFSSSPQNPSCPAGSWCTLERESVVRTECSDLNILTTNSGFSQFAGTYVMYDNGWNGRPVYYNEVQRTVLIYSVYGGGVGGDNQTISFAGWLISHPGFVNTEQYRDQVLLGSKIGPISGYSFQTGPDPTAGWQWGFSVNLTKSTKRGVHCPGSQAKVRSHGVTDFMYYDPPYLRMCSQGYYCPNSISQLACDDLTFSPLSLLPGHDAYAAFAGNYTLSITDVLNGYPAYINNAAGSFIGYHPSGLWGISTLALLQTAVRNQGPFEALLWQSEKNVDPKVGWAAYSVTYADMSYVYHCPSGTKFPTSYNILF